MRYAEARQKRAEQDKVTDTLHTKYRPTKFADVIGQSHFIKKLAEMVNDRTAHAFLFHGPSGCGKTTLARICANQLGCEAQDLIEHDGATKNGVDQLRDLQESVKYKPLGRGKHRAVILDEAHRISAQAFDSILKIVEEPPPHLFWFFCTTAPAKVPVTIRNRCQQFAVREVPPDDLTTLMKQVAKQEGIKLSDDLLRYIASKSSGSPRRALVNLERCVGVTSKRDAAAALEQVQNEDAIGELGRFICNVDGGRSWIKAMDLVKKVGEDANPESIRIGIAQYIAACLQNAKSDKEAVAYLTVLEPFSTPFGIGDAKPSLMLALGRALLVE